MATISGGALDDEEYAHPDGEDEFGETYRTDEIPSEMWEILDENGEYEVPSFIDRTIFRDEQECWVFAHTPAAGAIRTCPQTFEVQLRYTCDGNDEYIARLPITLIDIGSPIITIDLVANDDPHISFGGIPRYPESVTVLPIITVNDPCGVHKELSLNGDPYEIGTPISGDGLYFLNVFAEDDSGNFGSASIVFEIRERPSYTAAAVVETTDCTIENDVLTSFSARVHIAAEDFTAQEILRSSLHMILRAPDGSFLPMQPMQMSVEECWLHCPVEAEVNANPNISYEFTECPAEVIVLGVGLENGQIAFEWGAVAPNDPDPNAAETLRLIVGYEPTDCVWECDEVDPCDDPPPPPVECKRVEHRLFLDDKCEHVCPHNPLAHPTLGCFTLCDTLARVTAKSVSRSSFLAAINNGDLEFCNEFTTCGAAVSGFQVLHFVGDCCNCDVEITGKAKVEGDADWYEFGLAQVIDHWGWGTISILPSCGVGCWSSYFAESNPLDPPSPPIQATFNCSTASCIGIVTVSNHVEFYGYVQADGIDPKRVRSRVNIKGTAQFWLTGEADTCEPEPCDP